MRTCPVTSGTRRSASLAAHLRLNNLCWIYDSNDVTIEDSTSLAFTENVAHRFRPYGYEWPEDTPFHVPGEVYESFAAGAVRG